METVLPLRTAWIADILSQASLRDVQRQRCWKRGGGDGQRRWDYDTTERFFNAEPFPLCASPLKGEVQRTPELSARPSAAADSDRERAFSRRVLDCAYCRFHLTLPLREASPRTRAARSLKIETLIREIVW